MNFVLDYSRIHSNSVDLIDENFSQERCFLDYSLPRGCFLKAFSHASFKYGDLIHFNYCFYSFLCNICTLLIFTGIFSSCFINL